MNKFYRLKQDYPDSKYQKGVVIEVVARDYYKLPDDSKVINWNNIKNICSTWTSFWEEVSPYKYEDTGEHIPFGAKYYVFDKDIKSVLCVMIQDLKSLYPKKYLTIQNCIRGWEDEYQSPYQYNDGSFINWGDTVYIVGTCRTYSQVIKKDSVYGIPEAKDMFKTKQEAEMQYNINNQNSSYYYNDGTPIKWENYFSYVRKSKDEICTFKLTKNLDMTYIKENVTFYKTKEEALAVLNERITIPLMNGKFGKIGDKVYYTKTIETRVISIKEHILTKNSLYLFYFQTLEEAKKQYLKNMSLKDLNSFDSNTAHWINNTLKEPIKFNVELL